MTGWLDTSVIIRLITKQPEELFQRASAVLKKAEGAGGTFHVHPVHVAEAVYVLGKVYGYERSQVAHDLLTLLSIGIVETETATETRAALTLYGTTRLDFPDLFLAELARSKAQPVIAFDRDYRKLEVAWLEPKSKPAHYAPNEHP